MDDLASAVEKVSDAVGEMRVAAGAQHALTSSAIGSLTESVATLRADASALQPTNRRGLIRAGAVAVAAAAAGVAGVAARLPPHGTLTRSCPRTWRSC